MFPQLQIEVINLLIISDLYSKDMSLFKAHVESSKGEVSSADRQWGTGKPAIAASATEKSQLAELAFSVNSSTFLVFDPES